MPRQYRRDTGSLQGWETGTRQGPQEPIHADLRRLLCRSRPRWLPLVSVTLTLIPGYGGRDVWRGRRGRFTTPRPGARVRSPWGSRGVFIRTTPAGVSHVTWID